MDQATSAQTTSENAAPGPVRAERVEKYVVGNGPMSVDQRTVRTPLTGIGGGFIEFPDGGATEPWTLPYEEIVHVTAGDWTFSSTGADDLRAGPGDVVLLPQGATVVYRGSAGARAFYALAPADWYKRSRP